MHKDFELSAGNSNSRIFIFVCLAVLALITGCATTKAPKQTVFAPVYSDSDCQAAIREGARAMAECSYERTLSKLENRPADYTKARDRLNAALAKIEPGKLSPAKPEYERIAQCYETALDGIERIIIGASGGDEAAEAIGWEVFNQSAGDLLLVLEPYASAGVKGPVRRH